MFVVFVAKEFRVGVKAKSFDFACLFQKGSFNIWFIYKCTYDNVQRKWLLYKV